MDSLYGYNETRVDLARSRMPWMQSPKVLKKIKITPCSIMKMLIHAQSGVDKGIKQRGKPVEVMGLILGKPDGDDISSIIVTDVFPLPVEGAETRVLADDDEVTAYMINLSESLELTRRERLIGWYHSHPFEVDANTTHSHCYLSSTDVSTQLFWQRAEDRNGNPWVAIVIDPQRGVYQGFPEFFAFRVFPPEFSNSNARETPDGAIDDSCTDLGRVSRWGSLWNRYYVLDVVIFASSMTINVISTVENRYLWMKRFAASKKSSGRNLVITNGSSSSVSDKKIETMLSAVSSTGGMSVTSDVLDGGLIAGLNVGISASHDALTEITKLAVFGSRK